MPDHHAKPNSGFGIENKSNYHDIQIARIIPSVEVTKMVNLTINICCNTKCNRSAKRSKNIIKCLKVNKMIHSLHIHIHLEIRAYIPNAMCFKLVHSLPNVW